MLTALLYGRSFLWMPHDLQTENLAMLSFGTPSITIRFLAASVRAQQVHSRCLDYAVLYQEWGLVTGSARSRGILSSRCPRDRKTTVFGNT